MKLCSKIVKKAIISIALIIVLIIIGTIITIIFENSHEKLSSNNDGVSGLGLFISNKDNSIHNQVIDYANIDDYKYTFINKTRKDLDCSLSIFVNGKQISLLNKDTGQSDPNFKFSINNDDSIDLPIKLVLDNLKDGSYIVNFNIVSDYNEHAVDEDNGVWLTSTYNYTVGIENNSNVLNIPEDKNILHSEETIDNVEDCSQFIANYNKDDFKNESKPKNCIEAKSSTTIDVPIVIGGSNTTTSIIYATLDNKQIKLNNSDTLVYSFDENKASVINVKLNVPTNPGKYELLFYSLNNFTNADIEDYASLKFSPSHRITLKVE